MIHGICVGSAPMPNHSCIAVAKHPSHQLFALGLQWERCSPVASAPLDERFLSIQPFVNWSNPFSSPPPSPQQMNGPTPSVACCRRKTGLSNHRIMNDGKPFFIVRLHALSCLCYASQLQCGSPEHDL
eukprot:2553787-Amphidinium_carterae.4